MSFITAPSYAAGIAPTSVAVGDLNGDGIPDLAVANAGSNTVSVLLGKGDGTFQHAQNYAVGSYPYFVAVGDFNGDGHLDLVVANSTDDSVSVLLGNGDGTFQAGQSFAAGNNPQSMAVGDFNGDGHLDLVVANAGTYPNYDRSVSVLLGNGNGTFQAAHSYAAGQGYLGSVAVGDFNRDGILDLAVVNSGISPNWRGTVSILLGKGDGSFQPAQDYAFGIRPASMTVGDFNGDGILDLAVANLDFGTVSILLGKGDGSFQAADSYGIVGGTDYGTLVVGDFDRDGHLDLAVTSSNYSLSTASVLLGKGDGTFQAAQSYAAGQGAGSLAVGDFNGDGTPDLAVSNVCSNTVSVLLGKGDGTFQAARMYDAGGVPQSVVVGDFNGDGTPDLAVTANYGKVSILLGKGDGTFQAARSYEAGQFLESVAVGDFNGDGHLDLAVADISGTYPNYNGAVSILLGNGDGTFQAAQSYTIGAYYSQSVAAEDFNGDGHLDLVVVGISGTYPDYNGTVSILLGNGDGTFQAAQSSVAVADFNGDNPLSVGVGDFNGDGIPDLAVANPGTDVDYKGTVSVLLGNGDGTFQAAQNYAAGFGPQSVSIGDFNGDHTPDLAVANATDGTVSILLGNGDGTFQAAVNFAVGDHPQPVAVGNFNGDGYPDLAVATSYGGPLNFTGGTVTVLLNAGDWSGGPAPAPSRRPGLHRPVPTQSQMEPDAALLAASKPETVRRISLTSYDLPPSPVQQWPVETATGQSAHPEATFTPRPLHTVRHAQDAVFERWGDLIAEVLARNSLS